MATYTMLQKGSTGDEVKKLQTALGFTGKDVDGIFGQKTQQAVRDYQKANGLSVDGIAGDQTLGKLYATKQTTPSAPAATTPTPTTPQNNTSFKYEEFKYTDPKDSDLVKQADAMLQQQIANKPGEFQYDYETYLADIYNKVMNREDFSYDLNGDALYQQYKDQYTTQGLQASMDVMGQAQAMTGGYGNSYAQTVGQQTYQGYLQQLNDKVPELYKLALDQYNQEGQDLYNQAALLAQDKQQKYGVYRDIVSDYYTELDRLTDAANTAYDRELTEREFAYGQHSDKMSIDYQLSRDAIDDALNERKMAISEAELDLAKQQLALSKSSSGSSGGGSGSGSGGSGGGGGSTYDNGGYSADTVKLAQDFVGTSADGAWGKNSIAAAKAKGFNSLAEVVDYINNPKTKDYVDWDENDWNHYFSQLRKQKGKAVAEQELNEFVKNGIIPKGVIFSASIGARGTLGH